MNNYYGIRYYNPSLGRWLGRDSAGEQKGGVNLFAFCNNGPINGIDANGCWEATFSLGAFWSGELQIGFNNGVLNLKLLAGVGTGSGFEFNPKDEEQPDGFIAEATGELGLIEGVEGSLLRSGDGLDWDVSAGIKGTPVDMTLGNQGLAANLVLGGFIGAMGGVSVNFDLGL